MSIEATGSCIAPPTAPWFGISLRQCARYGVHAHKKGDDRGRKLSCKTGSNSFHADFGCALPLWLATGTPFYVFALTHVKPVASSSVRTVNRCFSARRLRRLATHSH